ncbi:MFS transporter [Picrophilus oshimae]|uniref:MFS transporter, PHS family, inorganic phosphate transporter n=1 Tax=Picrophilus torridus (strain ATCC 700027 / DSM 9790 / JCM 10055 / NBRC 100828 / KAW 2/3) TaxID=1122961 RepID=A0A8G2L7Q5_PICTO|nr:MFS transporter [Picrophilus oshimae]SMD30554.1 MFS transporter, PHS family, inorganic phosphate transporter [Picrophilus oshimae DSM 9789]
MNSIDSALENAGNSKFHYRVVFISGLGFFTDAYDLFIIGVVINLLPLSGWHLSIQERAILDSTSLLAAVFGALLYGRLLDFLGRKAVYGSEIIILVIGAIGSAVATPYNNVIALIIWRFLLGFGIGGDYSTSSTIMTEYSNRKSRGRFIGMVFSMQSIGLVAGPLITILFLTSSIPVYITWRALLFIGAIPAMLVIYFRRTMPEPPRYTASVRGDFKRASENLKKFAGIDSEATGRIVSIRWTRLFMDKRFFITLIGTSVTWFLMDWALYGNSIMSNEILSYIVPSYITGIQSIIRTSEYSAMIFGIAAFPGYWAAAFLIDKIGRRLIQILGFSIMGLSYILIALTGIASASYISYFLLVYGLSYFFIEFGPNMTTFVYPPELFPITTRGLGTGISAAGGKIGAFAGTLTDTIILAFYNVNYLMIILAFLSFAGAVITFALLPETKRKPLSETSGERRYSIAK